LLNLSMKNSLKKKKKMMALKVSSTQLQTQLLSQNKTIGEKAREVMLLGTMKLGKKTLRPLVRWGHRIEATEEIEVVLTKEVIITEVIEDLITIMQATTITTRAEGAGVGAATDRKAKVDSELEMVEAKIKTAAIKDKEGDKTRAVILIEADTTA